MTKLNEILDTNKLEDLILAKRINVQVHPDLPLRIYNYSNMAQFAGEWTNEERVCRGLIVGPNDEIIARGPSKFFNYGQPGAPEVAMDSDVAVYRKEDGSLGIGWSYEGHYGIATRGSFTSDQAVHATALAHRFPEAFKAQVNICKEGFNATPIYEIVYSENRIVLNYGDRDENIFLGKVSDETGIIIDRPNPEDDESGFFKGYMKFADALALPIPDDEEGYVLDIIDWSEAEATGHLKLKGDRYKELHGAIFGLSERRIWEAIGEGRDMDMFVADLPDELQPWAQGVVDDLRHKTLALVTEVAIAYGAVALGNGRDPKDLPRGVVAKDFVTQYPDIKGPLFSMLDGNDKAVLEWAHKQVRPDHKLFRVESQDNN